MIGNEKEKIDIEKLGNEKLDLKIEYPKDIIYLEDEGYKDPKVTGERSSRMLNGTIKEFLEKICCRRYDVDHEIGILEIEALNKNKDKIKQILDYVVNLDNDTLAYKEDGLIANFHFYSDLKHISTLNTLEFKKAYMILQLIQWGVNPFEIRRCLESKENDNFNWKKFIEYVMESRDILKEIYDRGHIMCKRFYKAMNIIRVIIIQDEAI